MLASITAESHGVPKLETMYYTYRVIQHSVIICDWITGRASH